MTHQTGQSAKAIYIGLDNKKFPGSMSIKLEKILALSRTFTGLFCVFETWWFNIPVKEPESLMNPCPQNCGQEE